MTTLKKRALIVTALVMTPVAMFGFWMLYLESYSESFDAEYVGAEVCGTCHTQIYPEWQRSPHANMTRNPAGDTVVGDFDDGSWMLPPEARRPDIDQQPAAKMYESDGNYVMALRHPVSNEYVPFEIEHVVGYQYRQVYVTRETGGVLRRLPLQWSTRRQEFFPYWNLQEGSTPTLDDLWAQMRSQNSAWNLFCARCHTTHLTVNDKNAAHTRADTEWVDPGIACEACHGPGSLHTQYFESNYVNRLAAYLNSTLRGKPVAYVANARKLEKGPAMSVCARCHGSDILLGSTDIYRIYEPGYSREGRTNDLSSYFQQTPLTPGRTIPTVEVYADGEPKGIGMLFRSMIESSCYREAEIRCYSCHNPHDNKREAVPGILLPSAVSNDYCTSCHENIQADAENHTRHTTGTEGSFCYDCHMPKTLTKLATGVLETTRTHKMSTIPSPANSIRHGTDGSPNACNLCHDDQTPEWAAGFVDEWYGEKAVQNLSR
jgi:predicted CXXCH cytochrome family protein